MRNIDSRFVVFVYPYHLLIQISQYPLPSSFFLLSLKKKKKKKRLREKKELKDWKDIPHIEWLSK